jgi:uncharacterized membrane protein SirB2
MEKNTSPHILSTSANLLGFCLFVITSIHVANQTAILIIDDLTSIIALILTLSCSFSFISIRTKNPKTEERTETIAEYFFIVALIGVMIIIILITLNYIK